MAKSVIIRVIDGSIREKVVSADVRLHPIGTPGERCAVSSQDGVYSFKDLPEADYSLAVCSSRHVTHYERITLDPGATKLMTVELSPGGFLSGQILDEHGEPPDRCWFTLIREGERTGKFGYVSDSGDHDVSAEGKFCSPPLRPATYFLRFTGILRKPASNNMSPDSPLNRYFDFLYPNAHVLADAEGFDVKTGETRSGRQLQIPRPVRYTIRGKVIGDLPGDRAHTSVMFRRDFGTIDDIGGGSGSPVQADGSFEQMNPQGIYTAELSEFSAPDGDGRVHLVRRFGNVRLDMTHGNLYDVEIHVSSDEEG